MQTALDTESKSLVWILLANRGRAQFFATDGGVKNLHQIHEIDHPQGRLKNREIEADRSGSLLAEKQADFSVHDLANKGEASFHVMQRFANQLGSLLKKARTENRFERLVLVAEPKLMGEIRSNLDSQTKARITTSVVRDLTNLDIKQLKDRLKEYLLPT